MISRKVYRVSYIVFFKRLLHMMFKADTSDESIYFGIMNHV